MKYTSEKIEDQQLMFKITTENKGEEITFNVVCAKDESEIDGLVAYHLDFINNPQPVIPQEPVPPTAAELMAELQALTAKIQALEAK